MTFIDLLSIKRGHFALESGLHGDVWFDLEPVFLRPKMLAPFTDGLGELLAKHELSAVCGAMTGGAFIAYSIAAQLGLDFFYTERHVHSVEGGGVKVEYSLPGFMRAAVANQRVGVVDDVINAGSAVTKTCDELRRFGAISVILASILTVGGPPPKRLAGDYPRVMSLEHLESNLWDLQSCPLCRFGVELIDPYDPNLR
jgi:orotate phosphoribosyltransferase